jgi:hypothetical protein
LDLRLEDLVLGRETVGAFGVEGSVLEALDVLFDVAKVLDPLLGLGKLVLDLAELGF